MVGLHQSRHSSLLCVCPWELQKSGNKVHLDLCSDHFTEGQITGQASSGQRPLGRAASLEQRMRFCGTWGALLGGCVGPLPGFGVSENRHPCRCGGAAAAGLASTPGTAALGPAWQMALHVRNRTPSSRLPGPPQCPFRGCKCPASAPSTQGDRSHFPSL